MATRSAKSGRFEKETTVTDKKKAEDQEEAEAAPQVVEDIPNYEPEPFNLTRHPNGEHKKLLIVRPNGGGGREINAEDWPKFGKTPGEWVIKETQVIAPHHSDEY